MLSWPAAGRAEPGPDGTAAGLVPDRGILFGAAADRRNGQDYEDAIDDLETTLGRKLDLHRVYRLWDESVSDSIITGDVRRGRIPVLSIKPKFKDGRTISWAAIARGEADAAIVRQADSIAALDGPLILSFHHEPDLRDNLGFGTAAEYVAAWRHYRQVFADRKVTNVAFVWIGITSSFSNTSVADAYYPGDDVVDWIAVDAFNWFGCMAGLPTSWRSLSSVLGQFVAWAEPHGKPLMVAEWGSPEDPAQPDRKATWLQDAVAMTKSYPQIKALSYLHAHGSCPWWLDSTPQARAAFVTASADPWTHPHASAFLSPSTRLGPAPLTLSFDGSGSTGTDPATGTGVATWTLDYGDGSPVVTGTGQPGTTVHTYPPGRYLVSLEIVDTSGDVDRDVQQIDAAGAPVVTSGVRDVTDTSVTLRAWVSPQGLPATAEFEWGTSTGYGERSGPVPVGATFGTVALAHPIAGLVPGTRYYLRVTATTTAGSSTRAWTFDTLGPPTVGYGTPTSLTATSVVLNGRVHTHSLPTTYRYQWGRTTSYGATTAETALGAATWERSAPVTLTGLTTRTTYHYRIVASNELGQVYGPDQTVTTR